MKLIFLLPSSQQSLQVDLDNELTYQKEQASFLNDQPILQPLNSSQQYPSFLFSFNYTNSCSGNSGIQVAFRNVHGALNQNSNEMK